MEPLNQANHRQQTPAPTPARRSVRPRAPLYASPWMALFIILRNELRQTRTLES